MKIAFISFEYPPDTEYGGIATYIYQVAHLLHNRNHQVEVFSATLGKEKTAKDEDGILVHRIANCDKFSFKKKILPVFIDRYKKTTFDIIESPEYMADGLEIKNHFPNLPMVVKLHTPDFWVKEISGVNPPIPSWSARLQFNLGAYRRFRKPKPFWWKYKKESDPDYQITNLAEMISTPSVSLRKITARRWQIAKERIVHLPYPFIPNSKLLEIPVETHNHVISFFGRLEIRKGVGIFQHVIPMVLKRFPSAKFRFIGKDQPFQFDQLSTKEFLSLKLGKFINNIDFIDQVPYEQIPTYFAETDVCVFPSIWENFPNVCLEAMSAGRGIVASNQGGMKDMLSDPACGLLVNPKSEKSVAKSIIKLLNQPSLRYHLGNKARKKVLDKYNAVVIGEAIENQYDQLIKKLNGS
jgi:glycogen(starch) synthase